MGRKTDQDCAFQKLYEALQTHLKTIADPWDINSFVQSLI